jgi:hypothetical protein
MSSVSNFEPAKIDNNSYMNKQRLYFFHKIKPLKMSIFFEKPSMKLKTAEKPKKIRFSI